MVITGVRFLTCHKTMMVSSMIVACCIALSLYSLLLKERFKALPALLFAFIFLAIALGVLIAIASEHDVFMIFSPVFVAAWSTFVILNMLVVIPTLQRNESFYIAFLVQTDVTLILGNCIQKIKQKNKSAKGEESRADQS